MKCKSVNKTQTPPPPAIGDFHPAPVFKNIVSPLVSQSELWNSKPLVAVASVSMHRSPSQTAPNRFRSKLPLIRPRGAAV